MLSCNDYKVEYDIHSSNKKIKFELFVESDNVRILTFMLIANQGCK